MTSTQLRGAGACRRLLALAVALSSSLPFAAAQDVGAARAQYLDVVRGKIDADALTDADLDAARASIQALVAEPSVAALETLAEDANRSGRRLLEVAVDIEEAEADAKELREKLKDKTGSELESSNLKLRDLEKKEADRKALKPRLQKLREALYEGVLTVTARVAAEKPEEAYDALVGHFKEDVRQLYALEEKVAEIGAALSTLRERLPGLKDAELAAAERDEGRLSAAHEVRSADLERLRKLKERRIASMAEVFDKLPRARQAKEVANLRTGLKDGVDFESRALNVEVLGHLPVAGALDDALNVLRKAAKTRAGIEKELDTLRERYAKARDALITAAIGGNNMVPAATAATEEKCRAELQDASKKAFGETRVMEAAARAAGHAVARLPEADKGAALGNLQTMAAKERDADLRLRAIEAIGAAGDESAARILRDMVAKESDVAVRLAALEQLGRQKDESTVDLVLGSLLMDGDWRIRAGAMRFLGAVPKKGSVPALIASLSQEKGRLIDDAEGALGKLTGRSFNGDANLWKDWWTKHKDEFEIGKPLPSESAVAGGPKAGQPPANKHVSFYGISTRSNRILFVLDRSGSMQEPASVGRTGGKDKSGPTKFEVAREQLKAAVAGLAEGESFNIITYSSDVTRWQKRMVQMSKQIHDKLTRFVDKELVAVGGTNIHDALFEAFRLAGIGAVDKYYESAVDTIFFVTDGQPTNGEVTQPDEILKRVREWNRLSKITVHTIGVGKDHDAGFLRRLAEENGGTYISR